MNIKEIKNLLEALEALERVKFKAEGDEVKMSSCRVYSPDFKPEVVARRLNAVMAGILAEVETDIKARLVELSK